MQVALPTESVTNTCYLKLYVENIKALQARSSHKRPIPFAIMTSGDTHSLTLSLLESNSYFGLDPSQVTLLKQEKVPCLIDNDAHLALEKDNKYAIQTKPHGTSSCT